MNVVVIEGKVVGRPKWSPITQKSIFTLGQGDGRYYVEHDQPIAAALFQPGAKVIVVGKLMSKKIHGEDRAGILAQSFSFPPNPQSNTY